jgi:hypothetical protein
MEIHYPPSEVSVVMNSSEDVSDDSSAEDENYLSSVLDAHFTTNNKASTSSLPAISRDEWKESKENSVEFILPQIRESSSSPPRSKLPQSDATASTSTTLPVSDSSSSQQRSTPSYNPITNYSPARSSRRAPIRISDVSLNRSPLKHGYFPPMYARPHSSDDGDCSSIDSDEALERWAQKIRTELRHAEMVELAIEAERAAEAGEERFAGKPSTFGLDDTDAVVLPPGRPQDLRRRESYSEGTRIPLLQSRTNKIGILALRDIDEVFPSFRQFNTHLRTHFARSQVDEKTLVYYEKEAADEIEPPLRHRKIISPQRLQREGRSFLENFSLDKWVGRHEAGLNGRASNHSSVGHLLAEHIHSPGNSRQRTPDIDLPPGLELPAIPARSMHGPTATRRNPQSKSAKSSDATLVPSNSDPGQHIPGVPGQRSLSPKALFDQDDEVESDTEDYTPEVSGTVLTPKTSHRGRKGSTDFVTPARLRVIRNNTGNSSVELPLLLSPNTIIHEHETPSPRHSDLPFTAQTRTGESDNSLLLPTFKRRDGIQEPDFFDDSAWLNPSNSKDAAEKRGMSAGNNGPAFPLPAELGMPLEPPTDNARTFSIEPALSTPPHSPVLSANRGERDDADALREQNRRVVKVSVFDQGKTNLHEKQNERAKTTQQSQVIMVEEDPEKCDSVRTPQQDCNCLTLSPASSLESTSSLTATTDLDKSNRSKQSHRSHRSLQKSTSAGNLQSLQGEIEQSIWNPCVSKGGLALDGKDEFGPREPFRAAMDMIATLSPNHQMFLRKRSTLYVRPEVNDDFLHNYLYCSKPKDEAIQDDNVVCAEPCQDTNVMCGDLHMDMCCVSSTLADSALRLGPRKTSLSGSLLSLNRETSYSKLEPESWFDLANEHFDGVLEQLVGSANQHGSQWNVSFQAPGLKKNPGSSMKSPPVDSTTTSEHAAHAPLETSDTDIDYSIPQPLFEAPQETLSDTQFQLIYGMSREALAAAANRTDVDEQIETAVTPPRGSNRSAYRDEVSEQTLYDGNVTPPGNYNPSADIVFASKSL